MDRVDALRKIVCSRKLSSHTRAGTDRENNKQNPSSAPCTLGDPANCPILAACPWMGVTSSEAIRPRMAGQESVIFDDGECAHLVVGLADAGPDARSPLVGIEERNSRHGSYIDIVSASYQQRHYNRL